MKKVLLMVVDALATRVVRPALKHGRLPNLQRLVDAGRMADNCVPIFPSITPAATCAIVTGCYPRQSGVTGAYFYDTANDRVFYYGSDFWILLQEGIGEFFEDFLKRLNFDLLGCETLFERIERAGLRAGCINYLWFRGDVEHTVNVPWLLSLLPGVPFSQTVRGPQILCLGDFVTTEPQRMDQALSAKGGPFRRFGFDDTATAGYLLELVEKARLPDFTLAYFPDNDFRSHEVGPENALGTLEEFDEILGRLYERFGGVETMLKDVAVIITGDHSQTDMLRDSGTASVNLDEVLHGFEIVAAGRKWDSDDELMVCSNMRAAQIYLRRGYWGRLDEIVNQLLADERIDQVIWRRDLQDSDGVDYHVATSQRGRLRFRRADGSRGAMQDCYGGNWEFDGDLETVGGRVERGRLIFDEYPNAFERIAGAFHPEVGGDLWVTARPGYEFHTPRTVLHSGGSHGALHVLDSQVPLVLAGVPDGISLPDQPRTVDVAPLCLSILGLEPPTPIGAPHAQA